ncbi:MAG: hypothetical protein ACR2NZ_19120 [Rubripirellula sp.]
MMNSVGCARWKEPVSSSSNASKAAAALGTVKEAKNRVIIEVEFVNLIVDQTESESSKELWRWVDETAIDSRVRQKLIGNGIRSGFVSSEERFRERLNENDAERDVVETFLAEASVASDISHGSKRIPMRLGRRVELPLGQPIEGSHVAMLRLDGETVGRTLQNAQYILSLTATQADSPNQVRLKIRPEIQYGDTRQKWVSSDTALRIDSRRETWAIPELDLNVVASEKDLIVLAPTQPLKGLAKRMLAGAGSDHDHEQLFVLVRIEQIPSAADQL